MGLFSVINDPGSKPDHRNARRRDRQITFGKLSINLGLRAIRIPSWYNILVHRDGADCKVVGRLRLKCDGTRAETRFRLSGETDESI